MTLNKNKENKAIRWFMGLWENAEGGLSMRKVISVWIMVLITRLHNKYLNYQISKEGGNFDFAETILYVDYAVVLMLLGLILFQDILKLKFGTKEPPQLPESKVSE